MPRWDTLFMPLHATPAESLTQFATAIGWALRVWQAEKVPEPELERLLGEAMAGLEGLSEEQAGQWARVATFFLQLLFYRREEGELAEALLAKVGQSKFREGKEVVAMGLTLAQAAEARGEARGEERGAERAMRKALLKVLVTRFGPLPAEIDRAVVVANAETMEAWHDRALTAATLEAVGILPAEPSP